jgi:hypothetical protein
LDVRAGDKEVLTERFMRAQKEGDLVPSADPGALARYLHMVVLGLSIQAQDGVPKKELKESARRALIGWPHAKGGGRGRVLMRR